MSRDFVVYAPSEELVVPEPALARLAAAGFDAAWTEDPVMEIFRRSGTSPIRVAGTLALAAPGASASVEVSVRVPDAGEPEELAARPGTLAAGLAERIGATRLVYVVKAGWGADRARDVLIAALLRVLLEATGGLVHDQQTGVIADTVAVGDG